MYAEVDRLEPMVQTFAYLVSVGDLEMKVEKGKAQVGIRIGRLYLQFTSCSPKRALYNLRDCVQALEEA